jgi:hypothetical protein
MVGAFLFKNRPINYDNINPIKWFFSPPLVRRLSAFWHPDGCQCRMIQNDLTALAFLISRILFPFTTSGGFFAFIVPTRFLVF